MISESSPPESYIGPFHIRKAGLSGFGCAEAARLGFLWRLGKESLAEGLPLRFRGEGF